MTQSNPTHPFQDEGLIEVDERDTAVNIKAKLG